MTATFSESRARHLVLGLLIALGPPLLVLICYKLFGRGLINPEAMDYAQLGRNLSAGRGFTTLVLRPLQLTHGDNPLLQPELIHGPLYPFILALAFASFGAREGVVAVVSGLFFLLTIAATYLLGTRLFNRTVGIVAALVLTCGLTMVSAAISGLPVTLETFLLTALLLAIHRIAGRARSEDGTPVRPGTGALVAAGVLAGALYLTDFAFALLLPVVALVVIGLSAPRRARGAVCFLLPLALVIAPCTWRNAALTGNAVFGLRGMELWMNTSIYPGFSAYRMTPEQLSPGGEVLRAVIRKLMLAVDWLLDILPEYGGSWILILFPLSLFYRFRDPEAIAVRRTLIGSFLAIGAAAILFYAPQGVSDLPTGLLAAAIPGLLVFSVAFLLHLVQQAQPGRGAVALGITALVITTVYPLASRAALRPRGQGTAVQERAVQLKESSERRDIVLTDQPMWVAWYAERPALWLPTSDVKAEGLRDRFERVNWLFLSSAVGGDSLERRQVYHALNGWNVQYARHYAAVAAGQRSTAPLPLVIQAKGSQVSGLTRALDGFMTVAPPPALEPSPIVLARTATRPTAAQAGRLADQETPR